MTRKTIRAVIFLGVLAISGILGIQVYWTKKALDLEDQQFRQTVMASLRDVAHEISKVDSFPVIDNPVEQVSSNYYVVNLRTPLDPEILEHFLIEDFKSKNLTTDFEYGIYNCDSDQIVYGGYVNNKMEVVPGKSVGNLEKSEKFLNYFGIKFPSRNAYLVSKIDIWVISSIITLLFTAFFGYAMMVILKQKRLSEVQRDFINNMTHEFQTPISTIKIATDVIGTSKITTQPERLKKYVDIIKFENNRLKNQVESLLTTAKLGKNTTELNLELVDLHAVIWESTEGMRMELGDHLVLKLDSEKTTVKADKNHLMNIVRNLLDNAKKYSPVPPEITLATYNDGKNIFISIKDKGQGISKEHLKRIFEKFYRVPTGNLHNVKGFGLGLNYVKEIVRLHEWKISVVSKLDEGTEFIIRIPIS